MSESTSISRFVENPNSLLEYIERTGDVDAGFETIRLLYHAALTLDTQLDVILPGMEELWPKVKLPDEYKGMTFYDATTMMTPLSDVTIQRHTRFGKMLEKVPEEVRPRIEILGRKEKNQLLSVVEDEYPINDSQWDRIASANSYQEVAEVVREVKGVEPRSQWCQFKVDEAGNVWAHTDIGRFLYFERQHYENEEVEAKMEWAHQRALRKLGVTPK